MADRGHIDLASPSMFVLDEADRMLDMGFFPDIMWVVERMTNRNQTLLFSATFPQEILDGAPEFMTDPEYVVASTPKVDIPDIDQHVVRIGRTQALGARPAPHRLRWWPDNGLHQHEADGRPHRRTAQETWIRSQRPPW